MRGVEEGGERGRVGIRTKRGREEEVGNYNHITVFVLCVKWKGAEVGGGGGEGGGVCGEWRGTLWCLFLRWRRTTQRTGPSTSRVGTGQ